MARLAWGRSVGGAAGERGLGLLALAVVLGPIAQPAGNETEAAFRVTILDGAIVVMATALASSVDLSTTAQRVARIAAVPVSVIVVVAGIARIESCPTPARALRAGSGLAATVLSALDGWTRREDAGNGARFDGAETKANERSGLLNVREHGAKTGCASLAGGERRQCQIMALR